MNVLLINKFFYPRGGAETVFLEERKQLINRGLNVIDFSMHHPENIGSPYSDDFLPNVDYQQPSTSPLTNPLRLVHNRQAAATLHSLIQKHQPEIAHLHNTYHQLTPSILKPLQKAGIPILLTLHDYKIACPVYTMRRPGDKTCSRCATGSTLDTIRFQCKDGSVGKSALLALESGWHRFRRSYNRVTTFIAPSQFMKTTIAKTGVPEDKICVLHNGTPPQAPAPRLNPEGHALYFGRLSEEKGLTTLIKAMAELRSDTQLRIVGTGPLHNQLEKSAGPNIVFRGHLTGTALHSEIQSSGFVIVPSEWNENCSMTVIESLASRKPVIASSIGGLPEQVSHEKDGLLFPPGDTNALAFAIDRLATDHDLRNRLAENALATYTSKFHIDTHMDRLLALYNTTLQEHA